MNCEIIPIQSRAKSSVKKQPKHILSNRPAFRGTVLIFGSKFTAVPLFLYFVPLFSNNLAYYLTYKILKNVLILDQKSHFFRDFVLLLVLDRLVGM